MAASGVDLVQLVRPELAEFKARDTELSSWLSRPKGHSGASGQLPSRRYEAIHPESSTLQEMAWWSRRTGEAVFTQQLPGSADRGHRMFAPNVRGASGFGT
jgi:hypothetical protein